MGKKREDKTRYSSQNIIEFENFIDEINKTLFNNSLLFKVVQRKIFRIHTTLSKDIITYDERMYYRIEVNEPELYMSPKQFAIDIVTQMVLAYGEHEGKKLTSNRGMYKNKLFKKHAEKVGLIVTKTIYGYEPVDATDKIMSICNKYKFKTINTYLLGGTIMNDKKFGMIKMGRKPTSTRKYICPVCGDSFRATKNVSFSCNKCKVTAVKAS